MFALLGSLVGFGPRIIGRIKIGTEARFEIGMSGRIDLNTHLPYIFSIFRDRLDKEHKLATLDKQMAFLEKAHHTRPSGR